ncbi:MAG: porin family protein [Crocinitomicaceae bacterium]|nr:porin family protein [Crocinitomicaceae bacterium]
MKNSLILIFALSTGLLSSVYAQTEFRERLSGGLKAGVNYSNVWDEDEQEFEADAKYGFAGGAFISIPIGKYLGLQPEVLISQKGFQASGVLLGNTYSLKRTATYLDIPLQLQLKPSEFITILAGPQIAFQIAETNRYTYGTNAIEQEQEFENDNIRKNLLGFVGGVDINVSHFVISGRYGFDFQKNNGDGSSTTPRYRNNWAQLAVGFRF